MALRAIASVTTFAARSAILFAVLSAIGKAIG